MKASLHLVPIPLIYWALHIVERNKKRKAINELEMLIQ